MLDAPRARGLFHRAIVQSGAGEFLSEEQGREQTDRVLRAAGLTPASARELVEMPPERLMQAQAALSEAGLGPTPVVDGVFLDPHHALDRVPILVGHTTHDWSFMIADAPWYAGLTENQLADAWARVAPTADPAAVAAYRATHPGESPQLLLSRIATDVTFGLLAGRLAEQRAAAAHPVYRYEFGYPVDGWPVELGATHCGEVPFVFGTADWARIAGDRPERFELAREVSSAWLDFAATGVPTLPDGSAWPLFSQSEPSTILIDSPDWRRVSSRSTHGSTATAF